VTTARVTPRDRSAGSAKSTPAPTAATTPHNAAEERQMLHLVHPSGDGRRDPRIAICPRLS
jgi:hypothetical protein